MFRDQLTLQEVCCPSSHAAVDVRLAGFDVVVEVVAEDLDVRDDSLAALGREVAGEEHCMNKPSSVKQISKSK